MKEADHPNTVRIDRRQAIAGGLALAVSPEVARAQPHVGGDVDAKIEPLDAMNNAMIGSLNAVLMSRELQPATHFDPRLPGRTYPAQKDQMRLARVKTNRVVLNDEDLAFASITQLAHEISTGRLTSVRLTQIYLDRIALLDSKLFAFITVTSEKAFTQARAMDAETAAGRNRGLLHGIPYALKDVFDTAGVPTTWGARMFADRIPTEDAVIVQMLNDAGAVLLGKAAMGELANGWKWFGGEVRNPWNPDEMAGGSSGGSAAAVAAGLCAFSIGSDSLGSILNPADRCGVVGLRPTFGRVPVTGSMPLTPTLERIGPLTRTIEDAAIVLATINGPDKKSASSISTGFDYQSDLPLSEIKVGYSPGWFQSIGFAPETVPVSKAHLVALDTLRSTGVALEEVELPALPFFSLLPLLTIEAATTFYDLGRSGLDAELTGDWPDQWRAARKISAVDASRLNIFRRQVMEAFDALFAKVDMVVAPTYGSFDLLLATNFTGHPGLTMPCGFDDIPTRSVAFFKPKDPNGAKHRVSTGISLHGRLFEEGKMLAVAHALESAFALRGQPPLRESLHKPKA